MLNIVKAIGFLLLPFVFIESGYLSARRRFVRLAKKAAAAELKKKQGGAA
jgi:hypothetical protein